MGKQHEAKAIRVAAKGEPTLIVSTTGTFDWICSDKGSGADGDISIWRPKPSDDYLIIGDYAQGNYQPASGVSIVVKEINEDPSSPLLKPVKAWSLVYTDQGSGGDYDWSLWAAVPPDGYVAIGMVGTLGYSAPSIPTYRCVRRDLVTATSATIQIWNDHGSGAHNDVSVWAIEGVANAFVAQANYNPFSGSVYRLKSAD